MSPLLSTLPERIVFNTIFSLLGTSFVAMRLYVRYFQNQEKKAVRTKIFILSDFFMCLAWAFAFTTAAVDLYQVNEERKFMNKLAVFEASMATAAATGAGVVRRAGPEAMPPFVLHFIVLTLKCATFYWMAVPLTIGLIKYSFLCHFYNIAKNINVGAWAMLLFSTFLSIGGTLVIVFTNFFICGKYTDNWDPINSGGCTGNLDIRNPVMITASSMHLCADVCS
ncbi:hypothetical protein EX30DRAFT_159256 [Ascodesmis nigricans]|uniref:Uncharacterized protein n=1 Tax=Ascodesmis nigricans TaxID=341454 RepID=A0A4S2MMQ7_9PEZI|nr:hypothetical protein EX30DRAFT_159256 [Ascodesmis nigricans]